MHCCQMTQDPTTLQNLTMQRHDDAADDSPSLPLDAADVAAAAAAAAAGSQRTLPARATCYALP